MTRPFALGDLVSFQLTTGQASEGVVIHKIVEKRQPTIYLIECGDQRRAFRFENELALIAPAAGNPPSGNPAEFWVYLVTAAVIPPLAVLWALTDRGRWSTVVLGVGALAVAVMAYRMHQIWTVQLA